MASKYLSKWGEAPCAPSAPDDPRLVAAVQAVTLCVLFVLVRPSFVTTKHETLELPSLCLWRAMSLSVTIAAVSYALPLWGVCDFALRL